MPIYSDKTCERCGVTYTPTSSRQRVCLDPVCQTWLERERSKASQEVGSIYALIDPQTGFVRYVGVTTVPLAVRLQRHMSEGGNNRRANWIKMLRKFGLRPDIRLLDVVDISNGEEELYAKEVTWVAHMRFLGFSLVNGNDGGHGGQRGRVVSDRTGSVQSDETRAKISIGNKARWDDPEYRKTQEALRATLQYREKISEGMARSGSFSEERLQRMSETQSDLWKDPGYRANQASHYFQRTHCGKGHEFTEENTQWINIGGPETGLKERRCRECQRQNQKIYRDRKNV